MNPSPNNTICCFQLRDSQMVFLFYWRNPRFVILLDVDQEAF